ncbi:MAG: hypothetical protein Q8Q18_03925 [bacterium]|nr:hypothetical protein [bacterium]
MNNKNKGFVQVAVLVILLAVLGMGGYYLSTKDKVAVEPIIFQEQKTETPLIQDQKNTVEPIAIIDKKTISTSGWVTRGLTGANDHLSIRHPADCVGGSAQAYSFVECLKGALILRQYDELSPLSARKVAESYLDSSGRRINNTGLDGSSYPGELLGNSVMEITELKNGLLGKPTIYLEAKNNDGVGEIFVADNSRKTGNNSVIYDFRYRATTAEARELLQTMLSTIQLNP